ncbi:DoxX family protein [Nocardia cyriacigeorgica]|uniref:DoxX family protein n=1 Tax=Nocardia cyriacigeorgica TaxID=135487 RepID=A0A6P1D7F8_9NOCA|nr:DoxX family protein [Nocardia cyriacigeorgica]NEW46605.1 DoxX family protein [Nocardia cyriacigeorgica]NEW56984.1 DoxX family protein [Nocardia cyriacigeorgica]
MSDKSKDEPESAASTAEQRAVSTSEGGVGSPYDSPTGEFPAVGDERPKMTKQIPRTDEELGLDPDVDAPGSGAATAKGSDPDAKSSDPDATYAYASIPPAAAPPAGAATNRVRRRNGENRRGTLDLGLFLLRLVVGGTFLYHGMQKLAGWFDGPGIDGTREMMEKGGWDHPSLSAAMLIAGEVGGGILLILGLATPLAAGAVLAVILDAWALKQGMHRDFQYTMGPGAVELETILAGTAAVIILTGPGRWALDRNRGWATRPAWGSFVVLLLAIAAAAGAWWYLHGGNPLVGVGPFD